MGISKLRAIGFITAFLLLVISYVLLFLNTSKLSEQALWMDRTNKVITNLEYMASEYMSIETSFRGYMATRNNEVKEKYNISIRRTDSLFNLIRILVSDNAYQISKMDTIRSMINEKLMKLQGMIDTASLNPPNILLKDFLHSVGYTWLTPTVINKYIKQMEYFEGALLLQRTEKLKKFNNTIRVINIASVLIAFLLAAYSLNTYRRASRARTIANEKSEQYKRELENRVDQLADANKEIRELRNIEKFAATGRIARTIAHEVRNPLTNINLASEQLADTIHPSEETNMLIVMVRRNANRINQLISNLLSATKFSDLSFKQESIHKIIERALEYANDRISLRHIKVEKNYDPDPCIANVDEEKLLIAFLNIFVNAVEAMEPDKGVLTIMTRKISGICRITIADNGTGMPPETLSKLFEPFFTNKDKGSGLGLTNTQNIILNHKGTIEAESELGHGTTFIITLSVVR